jgi:hypothetical protein
LDRTYPAFQIRTGAGRKVARLEGILALLPAVFAIASLPSAVAQSVPDSNAIMGFETPAGWILKGNAAVPTTALPSTTRTQGALAFELLNPANLTTLTSLPVASTANALAGIGNAGAAFEVDVRLPTLQGNPIDRGSLKLFISSPSSRLNHEQVGEVDFSGFRPGIYSTLKFPVPDKARSALGGATFNDLTFEFMLSSPGMGAGTYLFDNLRVHSVPLVTANATTKPPAGYGGSVNFVVIGNTPVAQLFNVGIVQVPDGFHLKLGKAGTTTVQLALGYDGTAAFTCIYSPDSSDLTGTSYIFTSCTGVIQPGDLVGANWAQLTIVGGDLSMKLRAQLAQNPVGDLAGGGIIPPMPTFWGDFDGCTPAPVAGHVVTTSASCATATAQASQIVTAYFNKVNNSNTAPNWIVTPKPEFALRFGNGAPHNNLLGPPPPPGDPPIPFDQEGHLNQGGDFDAYWRLSGSFDAKNTSTQTTTQSTAHLDATLGGHVVLFGNDMDVVSASAFIDASSGQGQFPTCGGQKTSPDTLGCFDVYLFGNHVFSKDFEGSVTFPNGPLFSESANFDGPTIPIWIFSITLGATASVELDLNNAQFAITGFDFELTPSAKLGAHVFGGISLGIASGGLDAKVDLLEVSAPIAAEAEWSVSTLPTACSARLTLRFTGEVDISSGGGEVDLVATFGPCPFCVSDSWTLFSWGPLFSTSYQVFNQPLNFATLQLPIALCGQPLTVTFTNPTSTAPLSDPILLSANVSSPDEGQIICGGNGNYTTQYTWFVSPSDTLDTSGGPCQVHATFNNVGPRSLSLTATATFKDQFGRMISESSPTTSETITVSPLAPGPHINSISTIPPFQASITVDSPGSPPPYDGDTFTTCGEGGNIVTNASCPVGITFGTTLYPIQLGGLVTGFSGPLCTDWTATPLGGTPSPIATGVTGSMPNATWAVTSTSTPYTITMTTTDCNGHQQGTPATMQVKVNSLK